MYYKCTTVWEHVKFYHTSACDNARTYRDGITTDRRFGAGWSSTSWATSSTSRNPSLMIPWCWRSMNHKVHITFLKYSKR